MPRDYPARRARPAPKPYLARCTPCGFEGEVTHPTCPECSSRLQAVRS